jgi:hypothetical protein
MPAPAVMTTDHGAFGSNSGTPPFSFKAGLHDPESGYLFFEKIMLNQ